MLIEKKGVIDQIGRETLKTKYGFLDIIFINSCKTFSISKIILTLMYTRVMSVIILSLYNINS